MNEADTIKAEELVKQLLILIGEDPERQGLYETPHRVVKMWKEIYGGYNPKNFPKITIFNNGQDGIVYDEMIHDFGEFNSFCEHHMINFFGKYYFAYIPHPKGKLIGLSKVARLVDYYSARLQVQERLTTQIIDGLWNFLCDKKVCKYPPLGMGLVLEAEHLCKSMRGAKKKGKMRTTVLRGVFKTEHATRQEFLDWVNHE